MLIPSNIGNSVTTGCSTSLDIPNVLLGRILLFIPARIDKGIVREYIIKRIRLQPDIVICIKTNLVEQREQST